MTDKCFKYVLLESILRTMNHKQYKETMHYLRWLARYVHQKIDWDKYGERLEDALVHGRHNVFCGDLL